MGFQEFPLDSLLFAPATFILHEGTQISASVASVYLWASPLETGKHVSMGTLLQGKRRLRRGHQNLFKVIHMAFTALPGPGFWASGPFDHGLFTLSQSSKTDANFRQKKVYNNYFSNTINNYRNTK